MSYNPSVGGGSPSWSSVTGKPSTFPPETPQAISHITGLQSALDGKQVAGSYAAASHTHTASQVTDFTEAAQDVVGAMVAAAGGAYDDSAGTITLPSSGSASWSSITGKPAKFPPETPQAISHITGLQAALDGKQAAGSYAAATHSHAISDVTGLQSALDGKQAAGSYQPLATVLTNTTAAFTTAQETKLAGIATSATANSPDATLLSRANHTGSQASSTISDFTEASQDIIGAMFVAAGGTYDDALGTVGFPASSGGSSGPYAAMMLASNYTLTSTTAQQKLFNLGTSSGGEVLLETGIYKTRIQLYITSMSATSGNGTFSILGAGTATLGKSLLHSVGIDNTTPTTALTQTGAWSINIATNNMVNNTPGTVMAVTIEGILHVTVAGTVIPSIALTTAAAAVVCVPSYIVFERLAGIGTTTIGTVT